MFSLSRGANFVAFRQDDGWILEWEDFATHSDTAWEIGCESGY